MRNILSAESEKISFGNVQKRAALRLPYQSRRIGAGADLGALPEGRTRHSENSAFQTIQRVGRSCLEGASVEGVEALVTRWPCEVALC